MFFHADGLGNEQEFDARKSLQTFERECVRNDLRNPLKHRRGKLGLFLYLAFGCDLRADGMHRVEGGSKADGLVGSVVRARRHGFAVDELAIFADDEEN